MEFQCREMAEVTVLGRLRRNQLVKCLQATDSYERHFGGNPTSKELADLPLHDSKKPSLRGVHRQQLPELRRVHSCGIGWTRNRSDESGRSHSLAHAGVACRHECSPFGSRMPLPVIPREASSAPAASFLLGTRDSTWCLVASLRTEYRSGRVTRHPEVILVVCR